MDAQGFRGGRALPENLHVIPYVEDFGEHAAVVRTEIRRREGTDFSVAVDLPAGLEEAVLDAVRPLPRPSIIALPDRRAIPIVPSSAPIEAVRSFREIGGFDLAFIDTPVPALGSVEDFRLFVNACTHFGCLTVYNQLKQFGFELPTGDVVGPAEISPHEVFRPFAHMVEAVDRRVALAGSFESLPLSMQTRVQFMASRLRPLLARGIDVVLVCSAALVAGVLECLDRDLPWFPESFRVPTDTYRLAASEIPAVTREIPYFIWLYECNRDQIIDRHAWLEQIYRESADGRDITARSLIETIKYAERLALTDGQIEPFLRDLVLSAGCAVDNAYAAEVLGRALTYPPAYDEEDHDPLPPLLNHQTGDVLGDLETPAALASGLDLDGTDAEDVETWITPWTPFYRTRESLENEVDFMQYMTPRFTAVRPSRTETETHEFTSGFQEGLDLREILRNGDPSMLYVREAVMEHAASYVLDLRDECLARVAATVGEDIDLQQAFLHSAIYITVGRDSPYKGVGICFDEETRLTPYVLVTLPSPKKPLEEIATALTKRRPLSSAVKVALDQTPFAFIFTDNPQEITCDATTRGRLRVLPLDVIPGVQRRRMLDFCRGARGVTPDA